MEKLMIDTSVRNQSRAKKFSDDPTGHLLSIVQDMPPVEVELVQHALQLAQETCGNVRGERALPPLDYAIAVATILAQMHIDAVGVVSGLIFEAVDAELISPERVGAGIGGSAARRVGGKVRINIPVRPQQ